MNYEVVIGVVGVALLVLLFIRNWRRSQAKLKALQAGLDRDDRNKNRRIVP